MSMNEPKKAADLPNPGRRDFVKRVWAGIIGGVITLVQSYAPVAGHQFVAKQMATINLPRMKADLEAEYQNFDTSERSIATAPQ